jgi:hypothetical protein
LKSTNGGIPAVGFSTRSEILLFPYHHKEVATDRGLLFVRKNIKPIWISSLRGLPIEIL